MSDKTTVTLATIGYEGASLGDLIATLKDAGVSTLIDVREAPYSQREEFRKTELSAALSESGIAYRHVRAFGAPKDGRDAAKAGHKAGYVQAFAKHLQSKAFHDALVTAGEMVGEGGACLMCLERDPNRCHRRIVAAVLADVTGAQVRHLSVRNADQLALPLEE